MTPRSFVRTPSATTEDVVNTPASDLGSGDESLPPHTSEIGTLKKLPNHGTAWLGSSSGVYFVNTVRRAFSAALIDADTPIIPASEDILTGEDADGRNYNGPVVNGLSVMEGDFRRVVLASLGRPPVDKTLAMELVTTFFRCWHPLFPFLHGPRFLNDIEMIYAMPDVTATGTFTPSQSRKIVTLQLIINIASLDRHDIQLPVESRIKSTSDVTRVAGCFSVNHDIAAIQLLIAAELYLVATISLRRASTVAGMILKLIYHAGLHRCPLRYASLSLEDCEIRKRIFWSAYALDRHLSLSLGDPNTVQDNDIDVCLSGRELHKGVARELVINPSDEFKMHMPQPRAGPHGIDSPSDDPRVVDLNEGPQAREKALREAAMTSYVHYGKLTGRIIEIFHKSIHARFQTPDAIVFLNSDIETWWNGLPTSLTSDDMEDISTSPANNQTEDSTTTGPSHKQLAPFFLILYHQLQLLLNRPRLSLDQSTAEFQHGLQMCIKASRSTITALKKHCDNSQSMLLPGLLSAAWMAGLIIAFACQLGKYPKLRACSDITSCLALLESMGCSDWFTIKNCHKVLSLLLQNIKSRKTSINGFLSVSQPQPRNTVPSGTPVQSIPRKRLHEDHQAETSASPKRKSASGASPASATDSKMRPPSSTKGSGSRAANAAGWPTRQKSSPRNQADTTISLPTQATETTSILPPNTHQSTTTYTDNPFLPLHTSGSALYADPTEITNAQSSHQLNNPPLPGETLNIDDPMFWGNFDYNISDIFGAASWENMTAGDGNGAGGAGGGPMFPGLGSSWGDLFGGNAAGGGNDI